LKGNDFAQFSPGAELFVLINPDGQTDRAVPGPFERWWEYD
jgi:hypothetical protein